MPFVSIYRPSLQLGLLKSIATKEGFPAETFHLNIEFARLIGTNVYEQMVHHRGRLFGDWLFSVAAFGTESPDPEGCMIERFADEAAALLNDLQQTTRQFLDIRNHQVPAFIDTMLASVDWERYRVIGFTSTFQQNVASFALARRIKEQWPETTILFGGANFEGEMGRELVKKMPFIDYAISGEADEAFPDFLKAIAADGEPESILGVISKRDHHMESLQSDRAPFTRLDSLPVPDFSEYFNRALGCGIISDASRRLVYLPFESARGCWWGQKHHCTFCGLNGTTIGFRSKSPGHVAQEIAELARLYGSFRFEAVDNILDVKYINEFFPELQKQHLDYEFFYEVKANLTREKLKTLSDGGVKRIQPGIESLDSRVLKLMRKGVTGLQNVNLLRWSLYYGIDVGWNILWGFPGEESSFYEEQAKTMRKLRHLQPPTGAGRIWMERFSPLYTDRNSFPTTYIRAEASYSYVYPKSVYLDRIAYFFDYEMMDTLPDHTYAPVSDEVKLWRKSWTGESRPTMFFWSSPHFVQIEDFRDQENPGIYKFYDELGAIYRSCSERATTADQLRKTLNLPQGPAEIACALAEFEELGLMIRDGDSFLSLALPGNRSR